MLAPRLRFTVLLVSAATRRRGLCRSTPHPHSSSSQEDGVAYRWVDEQGVVHYGDNIPPQYASQDRTILNAQGIEVGHLDAQKTPEERLRRRASEARS